ncbi:MAG: hypothetical protein GU356_07430 [Pyrobaculum sp.]|nr:hypothetical protein [Pyrobaculum sp.]
MEVCGVYIWGCCCRGGDLPCLMAYAARGVAVGGLVGVGAEGCWGSQF